MTAHLSLLVKTSSAMGFAHYYTARKIAPAPPVRFSNAVQYRFVVFTIRGGQKRETVPYASRSSTPFPTDTLRSQTRRAERAPGLCLRQRPETRAVIRGRCHSRNAFRRAVRALTVSFVFPSPSISTAASSPPPIRTAGSPDSRLPSGPSGQCPASRPQTCRPKAEDCRLRRQSSASGQFANRSLAATVA